MKEIIKIFFGSSKDNKDYDLKIQNEVFHIRELGIDGRDDIAISLIEKYKNECDAFAVSGFPQDLRVKKKTHTHLLLQKMRKAAGGTPLLDGSLLRKTAMPMALKKYLDEDKHFLSRKKVAFYMGIAQWNYLSFFEEFASELIFADLFYTLGIPVTLNGIPALEKFISLNSFILTKYPIHSRSTKDFNTFEAKIAGMVKFQSADVFVLHEAQLNYLKLNSLKGKTVIIDRMDKETEEKLFEAGVDQILALFPHESKEMTLSSVVEAAITILSESKVTEEDVLNYVKPMNLTPQLIKNPFTVEPITRFAFVIHPLAKKQLANLPGMGVIKETSLINTLEKAASQVPGYHYCRMTGIKSGATGKEVEGDLYILLSTPKMLMNAPVEKVYQNLISICHKAHQRGAKIIGLGAYTKIVGDAGVTVNNHSPIPLTTGNSLSAASTLWAASYGIEKMGLVSKTKNHYHGTCVVIGATGSIGKVCAKILARQWDRIIIVAPRPYKVLELVDHLKEFSPKTEVIGTTNPNKYLSEADLIITSTSAQGERVLDIEQVKPGCVICDVSRPFDITLNEAAKRPDVLVIASGEVELPGNVKIEKTIGLHGDTVYACLAETAVLAMEGIYESFSLSRELSYERVVQIDRLSRKHAIRLSAIMGHTGEISLQEIELCRAHALDKLEKMKSNNSATDQ